MKFSLLSSQVSTASSIASSTATGQTSNTSGCGKGHPSDSFYRPKGAIYLQNTLDHILVEASQGQGSHLEALAQLAGCQSIAFSDFSRALQANYEGFFMEMAHLPSPEQADRIWQEIESMISKDAPLQALCSPTS